jgi:hypothetical protein
VEGHAVRLGRDSSFNFICDIIVVEESMAHDPASDKHQAHELIERLAPTQVSAVVGLLEAMLDPVSRAIANAPVDDEPETAQERKAVADSKAWFDQHRRRGISHEEMLADLGLTPDDLKHAKD